MNERLQKLERSVTSMEGAINGLMKKSIKSEEETQIQLFPEIPSPQLAPIEGSVDEMVLDQEVEDDLVSVSADDQHDEFGEDISEPPLQQLEHDDTIPSSLYSLRLEVTNKDPTLSFNRGYAKRKLVAFKVAVIDANGDTLKNTKGWKMRIRCLSSGSKYESYVDLVMGDGLHLHPIENGEVHFNNVRFYKVSSGYGGLFKLEFSIVNPSTLNIPPILSEAINVVSERLKTEAKCKEMKSLGPKGAISRAPGIGRQYAGRLALSGIHTVEDLANLTKEELPGMLSLIRKDRGGITIQKLQNYWEEARVTCGYGNLQGGSLVPRPTIAHQPVAAPHSVSRATPVKIRRNSPPTPLLTTFRDSIPCSFISTIPYKSMMQCHPIQPIMADMMAVNDVSSTCLFHSEYSSQIHEGQDDLFD